MTALLFVQLKGSRNGQVRYVRLNSSSRRMVFPKKNQSYRDEQDPKGSHSQR